MKLWKERKNVPFKKSFLLEVMTIDACRAASAKFDDNPVSWGLHFGTFTTTS